MYYYNYNNITVYYIPLYIYTSFLAAQNSLMSTFLLSYFPTFLLSRLFSCREWRKVVNLQPDKYDSMNTEKQIKLAAAAFAERWRGKGDEKSAESNLHDAINKY